MVQIKIIAAVYGADKADGMSRSTDVTSKVQSLVDAGTTSITPTNALFGVDPRPGVMKSFGVLYAVGPMRFSAACAENETVVLRTTDVVLGAVYGAVKGAKDVTAIAQARVDAKQGGVHANNWEFGDPAPGSLKHLAITWIDRHGDLRQTACVEDTWLLMGTTIDIPMPAPR